MGSSGGEKSAKKAKKEKRGDKPESGGGGSSKKRGRDGLPVPSTPGDEEEDTKLNPVCAIASPLADGKLTKKLLKVVKKGTLFFVQHTHREKIFWRARGLNAFDSNSLSSVSMVACVRDEFLADKLAHENLLFFTLLSHTYDSV